VTNAPTAHRTQHADAIEAPRVDWRAFRQGWRVATRLDRLLDEGAITPAVWQCAAEYRAAYNSLASAGHGSGSRPVGHARDVRLDRIARIRRAELAIGALMTSLVHACAIEDLSWLALGRRLGVRNTTARVWTIQALGALASAWRRAWTGPGDTRHDLEADRAV
jgi:hypothetical protein